MLVAIAGASVLALLPGTTPAAAAWQAQADAPAFALSTAVLTAPETTCTPKAGVLGLADSATISWHKVPEATGYRLYFGPSSDYFRDTTDLSVDLTGTLIVSLLGALFGSSTTVTVVAKFQSWESDRSDGHVIVPSGVAGVTCRK